VETEEAEGKHSKDSVASSLSKESKIEDIIFELSRASSIFEDDKANCTAEQGIVSVAFLQANLEMEIVKLRMKRLYL
jgi:hypothetical protein